MIRNVICMRCDNIVKQEETMKTIEPRRGRKLCAACKEKSLALNKHRLTQLNGSKERREQNSCLMRLKNPMHNAVARKQMTETLRARYANGELVSVLSDPTIGPKIRSLWKITDGGRQRISKRMKKDNPMYNTKTRKKVSKTLSHKIKNGIILYKKGPEHHLWKGNRKLNDLCRQLLYPIWTKKILERDNYTCCFCGGNKCKLHVHHLKRLCDIIENVMLENNINTFNGLDLDERVRYELAEKVVAQHSLKDGITVCRKCHALIDNNYRELYNKKGDIC